MKIYISEFLKWQEYVTKINSSKIEDWELIDLDGNQIDLPEDTIKTFKFTGLSNRNYIDLEFWNSKEVIKNE